MKNIFPLITLFCATAGFSQTRLISHKSHSGSMATFSTALENSLFDIAESNFGLPPTRFSIDSVVLLEDNRAVIISSGKRFGQTDVITFKPVRDTVYNHPLLSKKHSKDSIAKVLEPNVTNRKIKLINYDNDTSKKNSFPAFFGDDNFPDNPMLIFALALLSGVLAFISYFIYKVKGTPVKA